MPSNEVPLNGNWPRFSRKRPNGFKNPVIPNNNNSKNMKRTLPNVILSSLTIALVWGLSPIHCATAEMVTGKPDLQSAGPLAFGPDGVIFVADPQGAAVFAIASGEKAGSSASSPIQIEAVNQKIAALLGATADQIRINDLAVNPETRTAYLSVSRGRGPDAAPVLIRAKSGGKLELWPLDHVQYSKVDLPDPPAAESQDRRSGRQLSITDMSFVDGELIVAGLSNEEFSSRLLAIPYPFETVEAGTGIEIFHGSHGRLETRSPIRTLVPYMIDGKPQLLAAYTCTPLVQIPMSELMPGKRVTGKTIAELGNRNRPLDMFVYRKDGKDYILMANSSRGIMKITTQNISDTKAITEPVSETEGLSYETISNWREVFQLEKLDDGHALVVQGPDDGAQNLVTLQLP